jgi:hypothetical protein
MIKIPKELRLTISLHEAGHITYAQQAGAIAVNYHGPKEYPGKPGVTGAAGVVAVFPDTGVNVDLIAIARWHCAGSVVKHVLAPNFWVNSEDAIDYDVFVEWSRSVFAGIASLTDEQLQQLWKDAQQDVEHDLRSPAFRSELWSRAREIERKIPWDSDEVIHETF